MSEYDDTIFATATGIGKSAVAVIRVSGDACDAILAAIAPETHFPDRHATLAKLRDSQGAILDHAIVIRFVAPRSFTGEEMVEFQVTGSRAVVLGLLRTLGSLPKVRPAEAGEFARRAFENGKLDLVGVEGLAAVVEAETEAQLRHAQAMASGAVSKRFEDARALLLRAIANVETMLDFSDVEDASTTSLDEVHSLVDGARAILEQMLEHSQVSERLREGMLVVIAGPPNVGKSTLMNRLIGRDIALVSDIPGTTRDSLEAFTDIAGYPVTITDTAGLRDTQDVLERQGITRSYKRVEQADLILWLLDEREIAPDKEWFGKKIQKVRTKADLRTQPENAAEIPISALTGFGIDRLALNIGEYAREYFSGSGNCGSGYGTPAKRRAKCA